jgi:hypothetical protein
MNSMCITAKTTATVSAAFVTTLTGYFNVDALIAFEQVKLQRPVTNYQGVVIPVQSTAGGLNFFKSLQKSNILVADKIPAPSARNVTRTEDLILRRATLRAGRLISKGRFVSK